MPHAVNVMPPEAVIAIASDPQGYKKKLAEIEKRTTVAVAAETAARDAKALADAAIEELKTERRDFEGAKTASERDMADRDRALDSRATEIGTRETNAKAEEDRLAGIEAALVIKEHAAAAVVGRANKIAEAADAAMAVASALEAAVAEKTDDLARREGLFQNRVKALVADL